MDEQPSGAQLTPSHTMPAEVASPHFCPYHSPLSRTDMDHAGPWSIWPMLDALSSVLFVAITIYLRLDLVSHGF